MGCKESKISEEVLKKEILKNVLSENLSSLTFYLNTYLKSSSKSKKVSIDDRFIIVADYNLSLLAYALVSGSSRAFRLIFERFSASIPLMLELFSDQNLSPLNILAEKNHSEMMKFFLPLYFKHSPKTVVMANDTLDFHNFHVIKEESIILTPIQVACFHGSVGVIDCLYNYNLKYPDELININEVIEESGEGCALLAVRSGSLQAVKLLNEKYDLKFDGFNKYKENSLQICAIASSKKQNVGYFEIFVYLIEEVGINPALNYEEILLVLKDKVIIDYYQTILRTRGIKARKEFLESRNQVKPHKEKYSPDVYNFSPNFIIPDIDYRASSLLSSISSTSKNTEFYSDSLDQLHNFN